MTEYLQTERPRGITSRARMLSGAHVRLTSSNGTGPGILITTMQGSI